MGVLDFLFGGNTDTKTKTEPWREQQPYLIKGFKEADKLYNAEGPAYYPGDTVADFNPYQTQAQGLGAQRGLLGNATMGMAENYTQGVLGGQYLNNPYNDAVFSNIQSKVMPSVNTIFSNGGRYGSNLHADAAARGLTEAYAPYAAQMYEQGLSRMDNAARFAPTFAANDYADINALSAIGQQQQDQQQREIDAQVARYNFGQDQPANKLGQYMGFVGGTGYGGVTSGKQYQPGLLGTVLGTALGAWAGA